MVNDSSDTFDDLKDKVTAIGGNLNQFFLLVMGCLIFCKYKPSLLCLIDQDPAKI